MSSRLAVPVRLNNGDRRDGSPVRGWAIFGTDTGKLERFVDAYDEWSTTALKEYDEPLSHKIAEYGFDVDWAQWQEMHNHANWAATSKKFSNYLAEELWTASLDSSQDEELGEAETFGWFALFKFECAILHSDSQGFVSVTLCGSVKDVEEEWKRIEAAYEKWSEENDEE